MTFSSVMHQQFVQMVLHNPREAPYFHNLIQLQLPRLRAVGSFHANSLNGRSTLLQISLPIQSYIDAIEK